MTEPFTSNSNLSLENFESAIHHYCQKVFYLEEEAKHNQWILWVTEQFLEQIERDHPDFNGTKVRLRQIVYSGMLKSICQQHFEAETRKQKEQNKVQLKSRRCCCFPSF